MAKKLTKKEKKNVLEAAAEIISSHDNSKSWFLMQNENVLSKNVRRINEKRAIARMADFSRFTSPLVRKVY